MRDTGPAAVHQLRAIVARQAPAERLAQAIQLAEEMREVALDALRQRHPHASVLELIGIATGEPITPAARHGPHRAN